MSETIKAKLYYYLVEKNSLIKEEYEGYVNSHIEEHRKAHVKSWWQLIRLNWHYRILRKTDPLLKTNKTRNRRLPYMDGAESEILNRPQPFHLARTLLEYDIISFDIFDTLILRPFRSPGDLFALIGGRLNFSGFNETFTNIRKNSEKEAREYARSMEGNGEITIVQIYEMIAKSTDISVEQGIETEFQTELDYCFANPYMLQVFKILKAQGKKIIIASDMYFPEKYLKKILEKNGYTGYDKLYVSCDYKACKGTGELYQVILRDNPDVSPEKIVQVGDNYRSDIRMAQQKGLSAIHYRNVHEAGNRYRAEGMSPIIGAFYGGIVNTHLYNGVKHYPFYYEYGFTYMGLYIYGMCKWIHDKAVKEGIDKIIFLSRDGYIYQKVFHMFYSDLEHDYLLWSRSAAMRYSVSKRNYEEFVRRYVDYRINYNNKDGVSVTVGDLLENLDIKELCAKLYQYELTITDIISFQNKDNIRNFLWGYKDYILSKYEQGYSYLYSDIKRAVGNSKKIAIVDIGWTGHNVINLKQIIQNDLNIDCDIKVWLAAEKSGSNSKELLDETLDAYMFTSSLNRDLPLTYHNHKNGPVNTPFFEMGTQPAHPSFISINNQCEYQFDMPIVEDYDMAEMIEEGIVDFCKIFHEKSKPDVFLRNIPGRDAYMPFAFAIRSFSFIRNNFLNSHISFNIGSETSVQRTESLKEQFDTFTMNLKK